MSHCQCCTRTHVEGLSARAIVYGGRDHPWDPDDLGRCLAVSWEAPEHKRDCSPEWAVLVDHWAEIRDLLKLEERLGDGRSAPLTYARMRELLDSARKASQ